MIPVLKMIDHVVRVLVLELVRQKTCLVMETIVDNEVGSRLNFSQVVQHHGALIWYVVPALLGTSVHFSGSTHELDQLCLTHSNLPSFGFCDSDYFLCIVEGTESLAQSCNDVDVDQTQMFDTDHLTKPLHHAENHMSELRIPFRIATPPHR